MRPTGPTTVWIAALVAGVCLIGYMARSSSDTTPPITDELLAEVIQDWHNSYPSSQRFEILAAFNHDAVLDKTTGLVWEKAPQTETVTYNEARQFCGRRLVGERNGWRLPSPIELRSLVGPIRGLSRPHLPPNHPFLTSRPPPIGRWYRRPIMGPTESMWTPFLVTSSASLSSRCSASRSGVSMGRSLRRRIETGGARGAIPTGIPRIILWRLKTTRHSWTSIIRSPGRPCSTI